MVLHIIPFSAFGSENALDPRRVHGHALTPIWCSGFHFGFNVDGYYTTSGGNGRSGYVQVFRNGIIESAAGDVRVKMPDGSLLLYAENVEDEILTKIKTYMSALSHAEVTPPMFVMLAGVRMHGTIVVGIPLAEIETRPLRKSNLLLPGVTFEDYAQDYRQALKSIFDAIWNAAGYGASQSYGSDGVWKRSP